jgi:hypothetical protein
MSAVDNIFLLTIRGALRANTLAEARDAHNMTAGNPDGVAAARGLGDLSHNVFVTLGDTKGTAGELLIMDLWNNLEGFNQFFSRKQVQEGAGMIFAEVVSRDLWTRAQDLSAFVLPTPAGRGERYVGMMRGVARSREAAKAGFNRITRETINAARMEGQVSHEVLFRMAPAGQPPSLELLGVDVWMDAEGMGRFYSDAKHLTPLQDVFVDAPATSVWKQPAGQWAEW